MGQVGTALRVTGKNGITKIYTSSSARGQRPPLHPDVQREWDSIVTTPPVGGVGNAKGACGEPYAISNALYDGQSRDDLRGAEVLSVFLKGSLRGNVIEPCKGCKPLIDAYGTKEAFPLP